jgi:hypothetical protein
MFDLAEAWKKLSQGFSMMRHGGPYVGIAVAGAALALAGAIAVQPDALSTVFGAPKALGHATVWLAVAALAVLMAAYELGDRGRSVMVAMEKSATAELAKGWSASNPLGRLIQVYPLTCEIAGRTVGLHIVFVNQYHLPKRVRVEEVILYLRDQGKEIEAIHLKGGWSEVVPETTVKHHAAAQPTTEVSDATIASAREAQRAGRLAASVAVKCSVEIDTGVGTQDIDYTFQFPVLVQGL